jgi:DNA helicase-2/ATP-dependent DNA helicase PcrA
MSEIGKPLEQWPAQPAEAGAGGYAPIDFRKDLNDDQYAAVTAAPGPALVLAGAGSGKTRTLTYRVAWLLHQGIRPWEMLLLTFTNKAAKEMLTRVEDLTGAPRGEFWGGTFHSVGQRFLRRHGRVAGIEPNFTIMDQDDAEALLGEVIRRLDPKFTKNKEHPKPSVIHNLYSYMRNTRQTLAQVIAEKHPWLGELQETLQGFYDAYTQAKKEKQVTDYDDLLEHWLKVLQTDAGVREYYQRRFKHILVDEYQDTNKLQGEIVDLLAGQHQLMAVGDDAQCIYTWRGANFENIRGFPERHPGTNIYKIEVNYRSTPEILAFANGILDHQPSAEGFSKHLRAARESGRKPVVIAALDTRSQASLVIRRIRELHQNEDVALHEIAILYRAHFQAMDLQLELARAQIPFTITSGVRFFEQAHIRDLVAHLRFAHNPRDTVAFRRLAELLPGIGPKKADQLITLAGETARKAGKSMIQALTEDAVILKVPEESRGDFHDLALTLQNLEEALEAAGAAQLHPEETEGSFEFRASSLELKKTEDRVEQEELFAEDFDQRSEEERKEKSEAPAFAKAAEGNSTARKAAELALKRIGGVQATKPAEVVKLAIEGWYGDYLRNLHDNWQSRRDDLDSLVGFAQRFGEMNELLAQLVLLNGETGDRSVDPHADTLRLTTIHQAKGLEFPVVFLIGVADGMLPLKRAIEEGDVEEERRLFYVGATRAMNELNILYPRVTMQGGPPTELDASRFLMEIDPGTYEEFRATMGVY